VNDRWRIRAATLADASPLAALAEATFRAAFSASNSAADMDAYCASAFGGHIQTHELADADTTTLVAENGEGFIAYAQLVVRRAPVAVDAKRPIELKRFYVAAPFQGSHLAPALMDRVVEVAATGGCDLLWLGVWEHNPRAARFYSKCGFHEAGEQVFFVGADRQRDLIMLRRLVDAS
jgi:GNAT superfamily N-acetyltransferase